MNRKKDIEKASKHMFRGRADLMVYETHITSPLFALDHAKLDQILSFLSKNMCRLPFFTTTILTNN